MKLHFPEKVGDLFFKTFFAFGFFLRRLKIVMFPMSTFECVVTFSRALSAFFYRTEVVVVPLATTVDERFAHSVSNVVEKARYCCATGARHRRQMADHLLKTRRSS